MKNIKFYIGPMSKNIVDSIIEFCNINDYRIGLIASRRQIDYNSGYVNGWNTKSFSDYVKTKTENVLVCRDHGGIGQGDYYDNGTLSFYNDSKRYNLIHIDPWKVHKKYEDGLRETIDNIIFINSLNDKCLFEVGTEESIRRFETNEFEKFLYDLKNGLGVIFDKIVYGVIQSGTGLLGTENIGKFNNDRCKDMSKICKKYGIQSKEHNGDYLTNEEIRLRFNLGLDAINIAPEFGVFETKIILESLNNEQIDNLYNLCYDSKKWVKWFSDDFIPEENKKLLIETCGHYLFNDENFKKIKYSIPNIDNKIKKLLLEKLKIMKEINEDR